MNALSSHQPYTRDRLDWRIRVWLLMSFEAHRANPQLAFCSSLTQTMSVIVATFRSEDIGQGMPIQFDVEALHAEIGDFAAHRLQAFLADQ